LQNYDLLVPHPKMQIENPTIVVQDSTIVVGDSTKCIQNKIILMYEMKGCCKKCKSRIKEMQNVVKLLQ
jgi:hypothetical protein